MLDGKYTAKALGMLGMVAYPVLVGGVALSIAYEAPLRVVVAWLLALGLASVPGVLKLQHDLDVASAARAQAEWKGRGDPVVIVPARPVQQATPGPALEQPLGPQVSDPWTAPPG